MISVGIMRFWSLQSRRYLASDFFCQIHRISKQAVRQESVRTYCFDLIIIVSVMSEPVRYHDWDWDLKDLGIIMNCCY